MPGQGERSEIPTYIHPYVMDNINLTPGMFAGFINFDARKADRTNAEVRFSRR
jgi:hypothetical protein